MNKIIKFIFILFLLVILFPVNTFASENIRPKPFIIDTDFSSDNDDAFAISTAMYFQDQGLIDIKGVALCTTSTRGGWAMSALLGQHKKWDIPICVDWDDGLVIGSKYYLGMCKYPYSEKQIVDSVSFYRMLLASSPEPVNIVSLGQTINIARLLDSEPDVHSPLTGYELVQQKVDTLYILGCKANGKSENNMWYSGENYPNNKWYGATGVTDSAIHIAKDFPSRVVFMTSELGGVFNVGGFLIKTDSKKEDILTNCLYDQETLNGCVAFDPMGIYIAALDANDMLEEHNLTLQSGTMRIFSNSCSEFIDNDITRNHYRVIKLTENSYYQNQINQMLIYEYIKRSGNVNIKY